MYIMVLTSSITNLSTFRSAPRVNTSPLKFTHLQYTKSALSFGLFKRSIYALIPLAYTFFTMSNINNYSAIVNSKSTYSGVFSRYYAKVQNSGYANTELRSKVLRTYTTDVCNLVVFTQPRKQLFVVLFHNKPTFIFTGGLMRIVINERKKSSKKNYKVAVSLIKLVTLLIHKKVPAMRGSRLLVKINTFIKLRYKILSTLLNQNITPNISYVLTSGYRTYGAQKFPTRRSVKKYVKKRFS